MYYYKTNFILSMKYIFIVFFLINFGYSQQGEQSKNAIEDIVFGGSVVNNSDLNEIPLLDFKKDNLILFNGKIDGTEHIFLYDSGATISLISDEIAKDYVSLAQVPLKDGLGKQKKADIITKNIQINNAIFNNIGFAVVDLSEIRRKTCLNIDGVFGCNALTLCNWKINPIEEKIYFSKNSFPMYDINNTHNLELYSKLLPIINISLNKKNIWIAIDTGFSESLKLNNESLTDIVNKKAKIKKGFGNYFTTINSATNLEIKETIIDTISLDKQLFFNLKTLISIDKPSIGVKFLKNYITTLNFKDKKICFSEIRKSTKEDYYEYNFKFILNNKNELVINFIWDDESDKSDLKINDVVYSINNINCENLDFENYCKIKEILKTEDTVNITFKKNKEKIIMLKKVSL